MLSISHGLSCYYSLLFGRRVKGMLQISRDTGAGILPEPF